MNGFKGNFKKNEGMKDPQQNGKGGQDMGVFRESLPFGDEVAKDDSFLF